MLLIRILFYYFVFQQAFGLNLNFVQQEAARCCLDGCGPSEVEALSSYIDASLDIAVGEVPLQLEELSALTRAKEMLSGSCDGFQPSKPTSVKRAVVDKQAPTLNDIQFSSPWAANPCAKNSIQLDFSDNASGVQSVFVYVRNSANQQVLYQQNTYSSPLLGQQTLIVQQQYTASGDQYFVLVTLTDAAGNAITYSTAAGTLPIINVTSSSCAAGEYSSSGTCTKCPANTFSNAGTFSCCSCPMNTILTQTANGSVCTACPSGYYSAGGSQYCSKCPAGTSRSFSGATGALCVPCGSGSISQAGASSCNLCPSGSVSCGGTSCTTCPAGTYAGVGSASTCTKCPAGTFGSAAAQVQCFGCPPNSYTDKLGATSCTACPAGTSGPPGSNSKLNCV